MTDSNYKKIEVGQIAIAKVFGHTVTVKISSLNREEVFFRTVAPKTGQPLNGDFNQIEAQRYLTIDV